MLSLPFFSFKNAYISYWSPAVYYSLIFTVRKSTGIVVSHLSDQLKLRRGYICLTFEHFSCDPFFSIMDPVVIVESTQHFKRLPCS